MSVRDLCAAIVTVSDNPAANILLAATDGPPGLTQFLRGIGDRVTRLDRTELQLNSNLPGDPRDTTTAQAMAQSMEKVLLGDVLSTQSMSAWPPGRSAVIGAVYLSESTLSTGALEQAHAEIGGVVAALLARQ